MPLMGAVILPFVPQGARQAILSDPAFEIRLPAGFPQATLTKTSDAAGVDYSSEGGRGIARVQYTDMPSGDSGTTFKSIRANVRKGMHVDSEEDFTHQGHPGLRLMIAMPGMKQVMRMDCVLVGRRLYRVWFIARTYRDISAASVKNFFESLRILDDTDASEE